MKHFMDEWPVWKRIVYTNSIALASVYIGFRTADTRLSVKLYVYIAVFIIAFVNFIFLVAQPRITAQRNAGGATPNPWHVMYKVLTERPLITLLVILQLSGASQCISTTIVLMQTAYSDYVQHLPNAQSMKLRLMIFSGVMAAVAVLWLSSGTGLWRRQQWGWRLAFVLNALAAATTAILQVWKPSRLWLDPLAVAAVILLLLRTVRVDSRKSVVIEIYQPSIGPPNEVEGL